MRVRSMKINRRHFLRQTGSILGSAAGVSVTSKWIPAQSDSNTPRSGAETHGGNEDWLDFRAAQLLAPLDLPPRLRKALVVLTEEVEKRTELRWPLVRTHGSNPAPTISVEVSSSALSRVRGPSGFDSRKPESYALRIDNTGAAPAVFVTGADERGVLYGVGKLLRSLRMTRLSVEAPAQLEIASSPRYLLRGHQLPYRPKNNSYDGWTMALWDQYIRELALFGCNFGELIPPRSDDDDDSPLFPLPKKEMMIEVSQILDAYGLDVWIWYPAMERDYSDPATVERELAAWGEIFRALPRVDAVFVPGGDPGHTAPKYLMALLEKQTANLHRYHPQAQMWVSPQSFSQAWLDDFIAILNGHPSWLSGVVYGPQMCVDLPTLRKLVPERYPLRLYPDITHPMLSQFPVPDLDVALALTEGREPICPRPEAFANIARRFLTYSVGFGTYSEGCNDDVNKFVWNALAWDPEVDLLDVLRDYSRFFISHRYEEDFAQGLRGLEKAWHGPLLGNENVEATLELFQCMERDATPSDLLNWRFQQGLYRAYYDSYVRRRLIHETDLYNRALDVLGKVNAIGSVPFAPTHDSHRAEWPTNGLDTITLIQQAQTILAKASAEPVAQDECARIQQLAEALFQSIRMQLSVERYQAEAVDRGGNLDTIDAPVTNGPWLIQRLREIAILPTSAERIRAIKEFLDSADPGLGGFYDDPGDLLRPSHVLRGPGATEDPEMRHSVLVGHRYPLPAEMPLAWKSWAEVCYDAKLRMRYSHLDPQAHYRVRVVYSADFANVKIRLDCENGPEIHPYISKPKPPAPLEFDVPPEGNARGELTLVWSREPGLGGPGRGVQVSEVWLLRKGNLLQTT